MYKLFDNYPEEASISDIIQITLENIKNFICNVAPVNPINQTVNTSTPVPSSAGIPSYILETTPLIFYSDVNDNSDDDFVVSSDYMFKISDIALPEYPVYCIFYSWMPTPILIFVTNSMCWHTCGSDYELDKNEIMSRPYICIATDLYPFNVKITDNSSYEDYKCCEYIYKKVKNGRVHDGIGDNTPHIGATYYTASAKTSPVFILDPFSSIYHQRPVEYQNIDRFCFAMSLYRQSLVFYSMCNSSKGSQYPSVSFISTTIDYNVPSCDIKNFNKSIICKFDGLAYMHKRVLNIFGKTITPGMNESFLPIQLPLAIFNSTVDYNVEAGKGNLYHNEYAVNWNSYRNVTLFNNREKEAKTFLFKERLPDTRSDKWRGDLSLIRKWMVPTLSLSYYNSYYPYYNNDLQGYHLDNFSIPFFPVITNHIRPRISKYIYHDSSGDCVATGSVDSHNESNLSSKALRGDMTVFGGWFPTTTAETLNNKFVAYKTLVYVKREPLDTDTYSLYCSLEFLLACQRLYDNDDRLHEYCYNDEIYVGISNRFTGWLIRVNKHKELII